MQRVLQYLFWLSIAATLYFALTKVTIALPASDKTEHAATFGYLTLLAAAAFPRRDIWIEALALSAFGALIEFIQPYFGRDKDFYDWIADTIGILIALAIAWTARRVLLRERNRPL